MLIEYLFQKQYMHIYIASTSIFTFYNSRLRNIPIIYRILNTQIVLILLVHLSHYYCKVCKQYYNSTCISLCVVSQKSLFNGIMVAN